MSRRLFRGVSLCVAALAVGAAAASGCGIDAVGGGAGSSGGDGGGGTSSSGSSTSSSSSSGSTGDGGSGTCVASGPESCEDGIDNDCNGTIDCEDPACSDFTCAKSEMGWTIVSVKADAPSDAGAIQDGGVDADAGGCPAGWTNPRMMIDGPRVGGTTCSCTCGAPNGNPCANGTATANFRTGTTNCNDGTESINRDGACHALVNSWNGSYNGVALDTPASIVQVSCGTTATLPPVVDDGVVVVCDLATSPPPTACAGGSCVRIPGADKVCLLHSGDQMQCPSGFPSRRVLASAYTDGRTCDACSCTTDATTCSNPKLAFYTNAACDQGQRAATADNTCNSLSGSGTPSHYRYEATANGGCVAASATVALTGAITLTDQTTLCCP